MTHLSNLLVNHYDVDIKPEIKIKRVVQDLMQALMKFPPWNTVVACHDGRKNLFTAKKLPEEVMTCRMTDTDGKWRPAEAAAADAPAAAAAAGNGNSKKARAWTVTIKLVAQVSMSTLEDFRVGRTSELPTTALQVADIVMRQHPTLHLTPMARSFFAPQRPERVVDLTGGVDCWLGYYQSARVTQAGLMLNVDTSAMAVIKPVPVLTFICEKLGLVNPGAFTAQHARKARDVLKGIKVLTTHLGYAKQMRVTDFTSKSAAQETFDLDGKQTSVAAYVAAKYNIVLKYPNAPCVKVGERGNMLPPEMCTIAPGQRKYQLNGNQTTNMLDCTCAVPSARAKSIETSLADVGKDAYAKAFGFSVAESMMAVDARQLDAPSLKYKKGAADATVKVINGAWRMDGHGLLRPTRVDVFIVLVLGDERRFDTARIKQWLDQFIKTAGGAGLPWNPKLPEIIYLRPDIAQVAQGIEKRLVVEPRPQIAFVFLPDGKAPIYGELKRLCDSKYGLPTQCLDYTKIRNDKKSGPPYQLNVLLKVNAKLGGFHNSAPLPIVGKLPTLVLGADVHHPGMGSSSPSIAAVVGSYNTDATLYSTIVSPQPTRLEVIVGMKQAVVNLLRNYYIKTQLRPQQIVMFRDGVGEGQFRAVVNFEAAAIMQACAELGANYQPKLLFLLVQKRHHVRLFAGPPNSLENPKAGTVVDTGIVHPRENDFYLCSHAALKGTSCPSHYRVLVDAIGCSPDDVQALTYALCHVYQRCTRSVSIPAPAYYAHLAAYRGRYYCDAFDGSDTQSVRSQESGQSSATVGHMDQPHGMLRDRLWYA